MSGVLTYDSNNSGGSWWLSDDDWDALEAGGWTVHWVKENDDDEGHWRSGRQYWDDDIGEASVLTEVPRPTDESLRYLGGFASSAAKRFDAPQEGVQDWEHLSSQSAGSIGCNCCGRPHNFTWHDDDGSTDYMSVDEPPVGDWSF